MPSGTVQNDQQSVREEVKKYYGQTLSSTKDIKTDVCEAGIAQTPCRVKEALKHVHKEVKKRYFGCGTVVPECLQGMRVIDLGSGSGQDCFVLSKFVGEDGSIVGLDMTDELIETAQAYISYHTEEYGYSKPNVRFVQGYMESLSDAGLEENSFDIAISNCVISLCPNKRKIFEQAYDVLQVGGEMYFSDLYVDRALPDEAHKNPVVWCEGLSGASRWKEFSEMVQNIGFAAPLIVAAFTYAIGDEALKDAVGGAKYTSATVSLFKLPKELELPCQATYDGSVPGCADKLVFSNNYTFKTGEVVQVNSEMATILKTSRFAKSFSLTPIVDGHFDVKICQKDPFDLADAPKICMRRH